MFPCQRDTIHFQLSVSISRTQPSSVSNYPCTLQDASTNGASVLPRAVYTARMELYILIKIVSWTDEHTGSFVSWAEIYHILWLLWVEK